MSKRAHEPRFRWFFLLCPIALSVPALIVSGDGLAHQGRDCSDLDGEFVSYPVDGPACDSPVGFCTDGELTGTITGRYEFTMTAMWPAPTAERPDRFEFTGISMITTTDGVMFGDDTGEIWFEGDSGFITTVGIIGGDQCYEDIDGELVAFGSLDLATGVSVGPYVGNACHVQNCLKRASHVGVITGK